MITTGMLVFAMFFAGFLAFCGGQFPWIIWLAMKQQQTSMMLNLNDPDGKADWFKLKYHLGMGAKDKRLFTPTGTKGKFKALRKTAFSKIDVEIDVGDYIVIQTKKGYPMVINGMKKLKFAIQRLYNEEKQKNVELESKASEMLLKMIELEAKLGKEGKEAVKEFVERYKDVRPFVKGTKTT